MVQLQRAAADYLAAQEFAHGLAPNSVRLYRSLLGRFQKVAGPRTRLRDCADAPEKFLTDLGRQGVSDHYRRKAYAVVKTFFRWSRDRGLIRRDPLAAIRAPIVRDKPRTFLDKDQVIRLLAFVRQDYGIHARRDHALLSCCFFAGLRIGEACRLRPEHLDFVGREILICGKGGHVARVPMHSELETILADYLSVRQANNPMLFPSRPRFANRTGVLLPCRIERVLRERYAPAAGLAGKVTPHTLRRSFASRLREMKADLREIQRLLRHAHIQTTMNYLRDCPEGLRAVLEKV